MLLLDCAIEEDFTMSYTDQNKSAWEYNAYDFWVKEAGTPTERAKKM